MPTRPATAAAGADTQTLSPGGRPFPRGLARRVPADVARPAGATAGRSDGRRRLRSAREPREPLDRHLLAGAHRGLARGAAAGAAARGRPTRDDRAEDRRR